MLTKGKLLLGSVLLFCSCFGPFDPYNPPPDRQSDTDVPGQTPTTSSGLVAHWNCNDSEGTSLRDEAGKYTGRMFGCTWEEESVDEGGNSIGFNGLDNYILISANDSAFDFGEGEFTVSLWVKPLISKTYTDSARYDIISKGVVEDYGYTLSIYQQRFFSAYIGPRPEEKHSGDSTYSAKEEKWFHCVMLRRKNGSEMDVELWVNGTLIQSYNSSINVSSRSAALLIGCDADQQRENFYQGLIDEIKILNVGWSSNDVVNEFKRFTPNQD